MSFRIQGLAATAFSHLFGVSEEELASHGVQRVIADEKPGYPDRISLEDAEPGASLLLLNHTHQAADTPYRASHAIFVQEGASQRYDAIDAVPMALRIRTLSLRAFDAAHMMVDADLVDGQQVEALIERLFANPQVAYLQAHYAKRGCFAAQICRAES